MKIEQGVTYWGMVGEREIERRVDSIETRSRGTQYVYWTHKRKDGSDGVSKWTELRKFVDWAKGVYEYGPKGNVSTE